MSKEKLLELVEALREAGRREHEQPLPFPTDEDLYREKADALEIDRHNAAVDAAARALVEEIEARELEFEEALGSLEDLLDSSRKTQQMLVEHSKEVLAMIQIHRRLNGELP